MRTYSQLKKIKTFRQRYEYLKLDGKVAVETFGRNRYLNQAFYHSDDWRSVRDYVILRDNGCDLGMPDHEIYDRVYIHHMNPITADDIIHATDILLDPEYLICCSFQTHNAIHYSDESLLVTEPIVRKPFDTTPWR